MKYSFENNLITPAMRVAIGTVLGIGLIVTGWFTATRRYRVSGQSLCATGVLVLYGNIFAAHVFYHLIALVPAFASMAVVTAAAFFLAVRMNAQVIVVLGLLGGFLTPVLLSTGVDNPAALFGYIAVLNIGIAAVALRKRWDYLIALAAAGTVLMQFDGQSHPHQNALKGGTFMQLRVGATCLLVLSTASLIALSAHASCC